MLLIPELQMVLILVPRTGSGSLRRAIVEAYPRAMLVYRHMEADGVPAGYDRWRKVGFVRDPVDRLWSLYKFLRSFGGDHDQAYVDSMRNSVSCSFDTWLQHNQTVFTSPYDSAGLGRYFAPFTVRHPLPENRKSQFVYLRPDLGTEVRPYESVGAFAAELGLTLGSQNATQAEAVPPISPASLDHCRRFMAWDYEASARLRRCWQATSKPAAQVSPPIRESISLDQKEGC